MPKHFDGASKIAENQDNGQEKERSMLSAEIEALRRLNQDLEWRLELSYTKMETLQMQVSRLVSEMRKIEKVVPAGKLPKQEALLAQDATNPWEAYRVRFLTNELFDGTHRDRTMTGDSRDDAGKPKQRSVPPKKKASRGGLEHKGSKSGNSSSDSMSSRDSSVESNSDRQSSRSKKGGATEAARKLDIAQKLKSREQELWSASSALVFLTEERDSARAQIDRLSDKLETTARSMRSYKDEVRRLERENELLLVNPGATLPSASSFRDAQDHSASIGSHNRQLTLALWWACSALRLERERGDGNDATHWGQPKPLPLLSPGELVADAASALAGGDPDAALANALAAQAGLVTTTGMSSKQMLKAVAAANDESGEHFLDGDTKAWQAEKKASWMMQSEEAAALDKRIHASAEERTAMEAAKKRAAAERKGGRRASSAWHARAPDDGAGGGAVGLGGSEAGGIIDDGRMGGVESQGQAVRNATRVTSKTQTEAEPSQAQRRRLSLVA